MPSKIQFRPSSFLLHSKVRHYIKRTEPRASENYFQSNISLRPCCESYLHSRSHDRTVSVPQRSEISESGLPVVRNKDWMEGDWRPGAGVPCSRSSFARFQSSTLNRSGSSVSSYVSLFRDACGERYSSLSERLGTGYFFCFTLSIYTDLGLETKFRPFSTFCSSDRAFCFLIICHIFHHCHNFWRYFACTAIENRVLNQQTRPHYSN